MIILGTTVSSVNAQPPGIPPGGGPNGMNLGLSPAFSPYLNMNRPASNPAINYFGLVRPQQQFASTLQGLQRQSNLFNPLYNPINSDNQPVSTGHLFGFQNQRYYFQNQFYAGGFGAGTSSMGGFGGGRTGVSMGGMGGTGFGSGMGPLNPNLGLTAPTRR
jgi:hypothetical protein